MRAQLSASQLSAARTIWRSRRIWNPRDRTHSLYLFVMVMVTAATPALSAVWMALTSTLGITLLTSSHADAVVTLVTAALWAGAVGLGRKCGPAFLPPFLTYAFASSDTRRAVTVRRSVAVTAFGAAAAAMLVAALSGGALIDAGRAHLPEVLAYVAAAGFVGMLTALLSLIGQAFPRHAAMLSMSILATAAVGLVLSGALSMSSSGAALLLPWVWMAAAYPTGQLALIPVLGLGALACMFACVSPRFMDHLSYESLSAQALRFESALTLTATMEFSLAAELFREPPRFGRHVRAVRPLRCLPLTFLVRDTVSLVRTPGELALGLSALIASGALISLAFHPVVPTVWLTGVSAVFLYIAYGTLARGLQYAAKAAGDYPLFGVSDVRLLAYHAAFPALVTLLILPAAACITAVLSGSSPLMPVLAALILAFLILATRLSASLRGALPPRLLTPVESPAGDLSIVLQLGWALGDIALAICAGLAIASLPGISIPLCIVLGSIVALVVLRWKTRR